MALKQHYDIFLSHNRQNKAWVRRLYKMLHELGVKVFFDDESIEPGEDVVSAIERGIENSRYVLLIVSRDSLASRWVALETAMTVYDHPANEDRTIIPVLLEHVEPNSLRPSIRRLNFVDLSEEQTRQEKLTNLLRTIGIFAPESMVGGVWGTAAESQNQTQIPAEGLTSQQHTAEDASREIQRHRATYAGAPIDPPPTPRAPRMAPPRGEQPPAHPSGLVETRLPYAPLEGGDSIEYWLRKGSHDIADLDFERARQSYSECVRLYPDCAEALGGRGRAYAGSGEHEAAIEDYNEALLIDLNCAEYRYRRALSLAALNRQVEAMADIEECIRTRPDFAEPYCIRAIESLKKGLTHAALQDCTEAIRLKPDYADAYVNRHLIYLKLGQTQDAEEDRAEAVRLRQSQ
jgi:TIR domain/Tetratricopeptide repeat